MRRVTVLVHSMKVPCTINRRGHLNPIPRGTYVKCCFTHAPVRMYRTLSTPEEVLGERRDPIDSYLQMNEAGVGSVIDHDWHTCPLELTGAKVAPPNWDRASKTMVPMHIDSPYEDMYYLVAFAKGMFWARFDWVEVVTEPV